jgi:3-methyladenine DNA glycosylase AlkC
MKAKIQSLLFLSEIFEKKALNNDFYIPNRIIKIAKILFAGIKEALLEEYPQFKNEIEEFSRHDPSGRLKYLKWQVSILNSGQAKPLEIQEVTDLFHRLGQNLKNNDLYSYKPSDFTDLRDQLFELKDKQLSRKEKVEKRYQVTEACDADTVYQSENFKVLLIKNKAASVHHGLDTTWCISMKEKSHFEDGEKDNIVFLFIINLQAIPRSPESKIALVYHRDTNNNIIKLEIFDASDDKIDVSDLKKILGEEAENILNITRSKAASVPKSLLAKIKSKEASSEEIKEAFIWAQKQNEEVRELVLDLIVTNHNIPPEVLAQLAKDKRSYIKEYVAKHHNTAPEVLAQLSKDTDHHIRIIVTKNPNTPPELLEQLAKDKNVYVREAVAINPNTPPEILAQLAKDTDHDTIKAVARNPNTPHEILIQFTKNEDDEIRKSVAVNPNTPPEVLAQLAKDKDYYVRRAVAKNPNTPLEVLSQLAKDEHYYVRENVAKNTNTPHEVLAQLAKDEDKGVRCVVAHNPKTPPEVLAKLAKDEHHYVRENVAKNPNAPSEILVPLANDKSGLVRENVAKNPNTPPEVLAQLAKDEHYYVRENVAKNPNTPPKVLAQLAKDENHNVRKAVTENPNTPPEVLAQSAKGERSYLR